MKHTSFAILCFFVASNFLFAQAKPDAWKISADKIDPSNYYGITVANGMIGIVSSPEPFTRLALPSETL